MLLSTQIMQTNISHKFISGAIAMALFVGIVSPSFAFAAGNGMNAGNGANFCSQLAAKRTTILDRLTTAETRVSTKHTDRNATRDARFTNRDTVRADHRQTKDADMLAKIAQIRTAHPDAADQAAIDTFETTLENAITTRRTAVDSAVTTFRTSVQSAVGGNQSDVTTIMATLRASVTTALDNAQSACDSGTDAATVRTNLRTAIESAKTTAKNARTALAGAQGQIGALVTARQQAIDTAQATFQNTVDAARTTLKAALAQ
jgi:hypothetical protein